MHGASGPFSITARGLIRGAPDTDLRLTGKRRCYYFQNGPDLRSSRRSRDLAVVLEEFRKHAEADFDEFIDDAVVLQQQLFGGYRRTGVNGDG